MEKENISFVRQLIVFLLLFIVTCAYAQEQFQYSPSAETLFNKGLELYKAGSFENSAEAFETGVNINPVHQRTTACYIMAAKSWLNIHEEAQAMFLLSNMLKRFPESEYSQEAHLTLGITYYALNETTASAKEFLTAIDPNSNNTISVKATKLLDTLVTSVMTADQRTQVINETQSSIIKEMAARANTIAVTPPPKKEPPKEPPPKKEKEHIVNIAALLPLMERASASPVKQAAEEVLDGIKLAQNHFEQANDKIGIDVWVRDEERDSSQAKKFAKELAGDKHVLAMIGPLFSNTALQCAPIANQGKLPLISPTANAVGIAALGQYIFQANADISMHGKALAQYAVKQLGFTTLAVIAPNNPPIKYIVSEFIAEAKKLGATVTANESYESSSDDLSKQFTAMRKAAANTEPFVSFEKRIPKSLKKKIIAAGASAELVDSLIASRGRIPASKLFGRNGLRKAESLNLKIIVPRSLAEQKDVPVYGLQGVFAPVASSEDLGVIASQMTYYNIKSQLLGSAEWYDESQLETQRRYDDGVIFCSDYYINEQDSVFIALQQELKKKPTKYTLFGYDAMNLVASCIHDGSVKRDDIRECLSNTNFWKGIHSAISLTKGRVNREIQILQFKGGEIKRLAEVRVE